MKNRTRIAAVRLEGGRAEFAVLEGVCVAHIAGVMLPELYRKTVECTADVIARHGCTAGVFDCSRAVVGITPMQFAEARGVWSSSVRDALLRVPFAVVVPAPTLKSMRGVLWDAVKAGYERTIFTDPLAAWEWAKTRAREVRLLRQSAADRGFDPSMPSER